MSPDQIKVLLGYRFSGRIIGILSGLGYAYGRARKSGANKDTLHDMRFAMKRLKAAITEWEGGEL